MKRLVTSLFFHLMALIASAQQLQVTGKVTDTANEALVGVNVYVSKSQGTQTNDKGEFALTLPKSEIPELTFSYLGYHTRKVRVDATNPIVNVTLEASNFELDELVIVSNRDHETRDEVPASVSVLTSKQIDQASQYSNVIADIVARIPGVAISTNRQQNSGQKLRGQNMLVLIDGIPQSTPIFVTDNLNYLDEAAIERIEVIKGATSIYGNGAQGGIINYITKKNEATRQFQSETRLGSSASLVNTKNAVGTELSQFFSGHTQKFNYTIGGSYKQLGVMRDAKGNIADPTDGLGETLWYNAFTKLSYDLGKGFALEGMYNYFSNSQKSQLQSQPGVYGVSPARGVFGQRDASLVGQGVKYNHNARLSLTKKELFKNTNLTATYYLQHFQTIYASFAFFADVTQGFTAGQPELRTTQNGLRLNFNTTYTLTSGLSGNIVYGLDILGNETSQPMADGRLWTPEIDMDTYAGYLQLKTKFRDFIFKGGTRYEFTKVQVDDFTRLRIDNGSGNASGGFAVNGGSLEYTPFTFNLGLRYNGSPYIQPYLSFSQGFSLGELVRAIRLTTDPNIISENIQDTKAVISSNYELGLEGRLNDRVRYAVNAFVNNQDLGTSYIVNPVTNFFELSRLPERVYGGEFEVNILLSKKLDFNASLSLVEGKTDNNDNGKFDDEEDQYMNGQRISPAIVRGDLNYELSSKWRMNLAATWVGDRDRFEPNDSGVYNGFQGPVESYFITHLFTSYQMTSTTALRIGVENLLNQDYYPAFSQWRALDGTYIKGNGATIKVSLNVSL